LPFSCRLSLVAVGAFIFIIFALAIIIFIIQLFIAKAWFAYFNFGPVEWFLRAGTYWRFKDLLRKKA
jgi:uncharacterized membrane protein YeiB